MPLIESDFVLFGGTLKVPRAEAGESMPRFRELREEKVLRETAVRDQKGFFNDS